jgi:hypothetical protein
MTRIPDANVTGHDILPVGEVAVNVGQGNHAETRQIGSIEAGLAIAHFKRAQSNRFNYLALSAHLARWQNAHVHGAIGIFGYLLGEELCRHILFRVDGQVMGEANVDGALTAHNCRCSQNDKRCASSGENMPPIEWFCKVHSILLELW